MMNKGNSNNMLEYETLKLAMLSIIAASVCQYKYISMILYGMATGWLFMAGLLMLAKYKEVNKK